LRQLGYGVVSANDRLPAIIQGAGPRAAACQVSIGESSQFASALLLCAGVGGWRVEVLGHDAEESPYVEMTRQLLTQFPAAGGTFSIEPDASSGSYFVAADYLLRLDHPAKLVSRQSKPFPTRTYAPEVAVRVVDWPTAHWQIDAAFPRFFPLPEEVSRARDLGDSIMTAVVLAPFAGHPVRFTDLGRLRVQECERVKALRTELTKCGADMLEEGDALTIYPSRLHGAEIETYDDHRVAMCFSILGLKVPGIKIINPGCVKKTFPNFFQKLAAAPPAGLGALIREAQSGRPLSPDELFAE